MSGRSYLVTSVVLIAAAALAIWALGQVWVSAQVRDSDLPVQMVDVTGSSLYPASLAAAWVTLAAVAAIVATRGRLRSAVAIVVMVCAAGIGMAAIAFPLSSHIELISGNYQTNQDVSVSVTSYWVFVAVAAVLVAGCAISALMFGSAWRSLSARQSGATARKNSTWDALDRGEDPTTAQDG